jgi:hypothetical protein
MKHIANIVKSLAVSAACVIMESSALAAGGRNNSLSYLELVQDQCRSNFYVFKYAGSAANHFFMRARMGEGSGNFTSLLDGNAGEDSVLVGAFDPDLSSWAGWYLMNGILRTGTSELAANWGDVPNAGYDLRGARALHFRAKGRVGGEIVKFVTLGVGWNADTGRQEARFGDSSKVQQIVETLSPDWRNYEIPLDGMNLQYVIGGFGWIANDRNKKPVQFFVEDIYFDVRRRDDLQLLQSYDVTGHHTEVDAMLDGVAFVYDNALACIAFLATGEKARAQQILDAFIFAQENDRYYHDGCLRNAYASGDLKTPPGWECGRTQDRTKPVARLPGVYRPNLPPQPWKEDVYHVSLNTGNMAWAMLAFLAYQDSQKLPADSKYMTAARRLGDWIISNCSSSIGFTAGKEGWEGEAHPLTYLSTEHNLDLYSAFSRLGRADSAGRDKWNRAALRARSFVERMWDAKEGKFWTGSDPSGSLENTNVVPLDVQPWTLLALNRQFTNYASCLDYAENHLRFPARGPGFRFSLCTKEPPPGTTLDGVWLEGTAQMATAYKYLADFAGTPATRDEYRQRAEIIWSWLQSKLLQNGALPAATVDFLWTGFDLPKPQNETSPPNPWCYHCRPHIGATCWYIFAEHGVNPFWFGDPAFP